MTEQDYRDSVRSCYSLAHSISFNGVMQQKLVNDLRDCEVNVTEYNNIVKTMLKVLLSNFT